MKKQLKAIRTIDPRAADYIESVVLPKYTKEELKNLTEKKRHKLPWKKKQAKSDVIGLFIWTLTPQGRDYWLNIWKELNGK